MKKLLLFATCLAAMASGAAQAQGVFGKLRNAVAPTSEQQKPAPVQGITPEAMIGQCPSFPSVATLVAGSGSGDRFIEAQKDIREFHDRINDLRRRASEAVDKMTDGARGDAERLAQQQTGYSVGQLQNMDDRTSNDLVSKQLAASGLSGMNLDDLKSLEGKSDDEVINAMTGGKGLAVGGLTDAEVRAMQGITPAQREAYMKQGDRMERAKAAGQSQAAPRSMTPAQAQTYAAQGQPDPELKRIADRWAEIDRVNAKEKADVMERIHAVYAVYIPQIEAIKPTGLSHGTDVYTESEEKAMESLREAMRSECFTLWRNLMSAMQGRIKTKMADVPRYDALRRSEIAPPSYGYEIASQYLDVAASVTAYPVPEIP